MAVEMTRRERAPTRPPGFGCSRLEGQAALEPNESKKRIRQSGNVNGPIVLARMICLPNRRVISSDGQIIVVVHSVSSLLAIGIASAGRLSASLVDSVAVPNCRCGGAWGIRTNNRSDYVAGATIARDLSTRDPEVNFRDRF
jgi:hypothetical protein